MIWKSWQDNSGALSHLSCQVSLPLNYARDNEKVQGLTSDRKCWITTVRASNLTLPRDRSCLSCRINPLWFSHFVLYCANSSVLSEESPSGDVCVWMHKLREFFCLLFSTARRIKIGNKIGDVNFYPRHRMGSKTEETQVMSCLHTDHIWMRTGINEKPVCLESIHAPQL